MVETSRAGVLIRHNHPCQFSFVYTKGANNSGGHRMQVYGGGRFIKNTPLGSSDFIFFFCVIAHRMKNNQQKRLCTPLVCDLIQFGFQMSVVLRDEIHKAKISWCNVALGVGKTNQLCHSHICSSVSVLPGAILCVCVCCQSGSLGLVDCYCWAWSVSWAQVETFFLASALCFRTTLSLLYFRMHWITSSDFCINNFCQ